MCKIFMEEVVGLSDYFFVDDSAVATGAIERDREPRHAYCPDSNLLDQCREMFGDDPGFDHGRLWKCVECGTLGRLQHRPTYIQRRHESLPTPAAMADPPERTVDWQEYLDEYFADGVLFLGADDAPAYPVREQSAFVVSSQVHVSLAPGRGAELVVVDRVLDKPYYMWEVQRLSQIDAGTLIVHGTEGRVARLEARLTDEEKAFAHRVKYSDYFGVLEGCGDTACGQCNTEVN